MRCPRPIWSRSRSPAAPCRATSAGGCSPASRLDDGPATVDSFRVVDARPGHALIELVLHDGRNRVIRRLMEAAGFPVLQLVRTQIGRSASVTCGPDVTG